MALTKSKPSAKTTQNGHKGGDKREMAYFRERLGTRTDISEGGTKEIAGAVNGLLADTFALYLKTKNFHWHMSGPHFRDYHLLLDEHADQIFSITDDIAENRQGTSLGDRQ